MFRRFGPNYMLLLYLLDLSVGLLALWAAQRLRLLVPIPKLVPEAGARMPSTVDVFVILTLTIVFPMAGVYDAQRIYRTVDEATRVVSGAVMSGLLLAGTLFLSYRDVSRLAFIYFVVIAVLLLLTYRGILRILFRTLQWTTQVPAKILIAGVNELGARAARMLSTAGMEIVGFVDDDPSHRGTIQQGYPVVGVLDEIPQVTDKEGVTDVIFALPYGVQERLANLLVSMWKLPIRIHMIPDLLGLGFARARVDYLGGLTVIGLREPFIDGFQRIVKRLLDLILGMAILLCALPVMGIIAIAVRLDSPGPIIFRQKRVGENGRYFTMYKFRSMVADAVQRQEVVNTYTLSGKVIHKTPDDPRVTRVGRMLRRFSLDELPQLVNVLRGEMSLVGPRPELPWVVEQYDPWQYQRLAVPQGMTSWYVVNGRSKIPMHLNTDEDLRYIRDYSFFQDLKIICMSLAAVAKGRGAF